jgi:cysteinyl-tRNA synthetase
MLILAGLVTGANKYIGTTDSSKLNFEVLKMTAQYITKMLEVSCILASSIIFIIIFSQIFGVDVSKLRLDDSGSSATTQNTETILMPYLQTIARFRDNVRTLARESLSENKANAQMLDICDKLRDVDLVDLNVLLEDRDIGQSSIVKIRAKEDIIAERGAKAGTKENKSKSSEEHKRKLLERLEKGRTPPHELYRTDEYRDWDAEGIPTTDNNGESVTKSARKKFVKGYEAQKKLHQEFLDAVASDLLK